MTISFSVGYNTPKPKQAHDEKRMRSLICGEVPVVVARFSQHSFFVWGSNPYTMFPAWRVEKGIV